MDQHMTCGADKLHCPLKLCQIQMFLRLLQILLLPLQPALRRKVIFLTEGPCHFDGRTG